jgi:hypothetical protein
MRTHRALNVVLRHFHVLFSLRILAATPVLLLRVALFVAVLMGYLHLFFVLTLRPGARYTT